MCSIYDEPYELVVREAQKEKDASLSDPRGVQYMTHLADLIRDHELLRLVLRTDDTVFEDVPVRTWWTHGWYQRRSRNEQESSRLVFDIPDEVWRRIQSHYAASVFTEMFGLELPVQLEHAHRRQYDLERAHQAYRMEGAFQTEVIIDDWEKLRAAIEMTALDDRYQLGGQRITLYSDGTYSAAGYAKIVDDKLEINIEQTVPHIISDWQGAFREKIYAEPWRGSRRLFR